MPITYGGIDLTPPAHALAVVEGWWHAHRIFEFDHPAYNTAGIDHLPIPYPPHTEAPRIGVLHWPTGASRWAVCHLLCTGDQIARLNRVAGASLDLVISDGTRSVTTPMYRVAARPVSQRGDGREMYLLTLVDDRYWWWFAGSSTTPAAPASWSALLTALFTAVGVTPSIGTIPAGYSTPTASRWNVGFKPLPLLIDAVCRAVGLRVTRSLAGAVSCVTYTTAAASDDSQWETYSGECLAGGRAATSELVRAVPASVAVVKDGVATTVTLASLALSEFEGATGTASKVGQVIAESAVTSTQAATDYYLWQLSPTDATLRGVRNWSPTGLEDCVEWSHGAESIVTRVLRSRLFDPNVYGDGGRAATLDPEEPPIENSVPTFTPQGSLQNSPNFIIPGTLNGDPNYTFTYYTTPAFTNTTPNFLFQLNNDGDGSGNPNFLFNVSPGGTSTTANYAFAVTQTSVNNTFELDNDPATASVNNLFTFVTSGPTDTNFLFQVTSSGAGSVNVLFGADDGNTGVNTTFTIDGGGDVTSVNTTYDLDNGSGTTSGNINATQSGGGIVLTGTNVSLAGSLASGGGLTWVKITATFSDFATAATTNDIEIYSLPAKGTIHAAALKHTAAFTGGSLLGYSLSVGVSGTPEDIAGPALDVFNAPSNTSFITGGAFHLYNFGSAKSIRAFADGAGVNLDEATTGSVDIYLLVSGLP